MPLKDVRELKRRLDAELTKEVLSVYNSEPLAEECADALSKIANSFYYLKGGNALSLLQQQPVSGDWDFQLKPDKANVYAQWNSNYGMQDAIIVGILNTLAGKFISTAGIENVFKSLSDPAIHSIGGDISQFNQTQHFTIGKTGYMLKSYADLLGDSKYIRNTTSGEGRLQLDPGEIIVLPNAPTTRTGVVIPSVYVNYSIPGFILYRLAIRYAYPLVNPSDYFDDPSVRTVTLKSELIDISVPRPGSAEVHMAQDGVITNFFNSIRPSGKQIKIPGWGYHLYENINLLQEIRLGVSGSPHKKQKRIDRGIQAFEEIKILNPGPGQDLIKNAGILKDSAAGSSLGFIGVYLQVLQSDAVVKTIASVSDASALKTDISTLLINRTETAKLTDFPSLVNFDFNWLGRPLVAEVIGFLKDFLNISFTPTTKGLGVTGVNVSEKQAKEIEMLRNSTMFSVVTPLLDLDQNAVFPLPFVLVQVNDSTLFASLNVSSSFTTLKTVFSANLKVWRPIVQTATQLRNSDTPMYIRFIFVKTSAASNNYSITDYLENSLLISQRQALADAYQGK